MRRTSPNELTHGLGGNRRAGPRCRTVEHERDDPGAPSLDILHRMTPHDRLSFAELLLTVAPMSVLAQTPAPDEAALDGPSRPRWEAGVAAGAGRVSDYPGADQTHARGAVVPIFIYRGPILRVDQSGIRGRFLSNPKWEFDLSATAAFNAKNNDARRGMPGLDYLLRCRCTAPPTRPAPCCGTGATSTWAPASCGRRGTARRGYRIDSGDRSGRFSPARVSDLLSA